MFAIGIFGNFANPVGVASIVVAMTAVVVGVVVIVDAATVAVAVEVVIIFLVADVATVIVAVEVATVVVLWRLMFHLHGATTQNDLYTHHLIFLFSLFIYLFIFYFIFLNNISYLITHTMC